MAKWTTNYERLDEADKSTADDIIDALLATLLNKTGTVVLLADREGRGVDAQFYYGGNELLVGQLISAGAAVVSQQFGGPTGTLQ